MDYTRLGGSGLKVSRIALGCMSFGDTSRGFSEWALGDDAAQPFFSQAMELGITFWDTANVYGIGSSEEIVGRALKRYARREDRPCDQGALRDASRPRRIRTLMTRSAFSKSLTARISPQRFLNRI
jgi:diketogulonate reductase-like aldo/keto reductase